MRIAVIGAGNMGAGLARQLARAGYGVALAGCDIRKARAVADDLGPPVIASDASIAAAEASVIVLAVPL